jgi:hypothetical protein
LGGVTTSPERDGHEVAVPLGTSTALTSEEAEAPGATVIVTPPGPVRRAWITWVPTLFVPATPGYPPVMQVDAEMFFMIKGTMMCPAAPELCPTVIASEVVEHWLVAGLAVVVVAGLGVVVVTALVVVDVVDEVELVLELHAAALRARTITAMGTSLRVMAQLYGPGAPPVVMAVALRAFGSQVPSGLMRAEPGWSRRREEQA